MANPTRTSRVTYEQARLLVLVDELESYKKIRDRLGTGSTTSMMNTMRRMTKSLGSKPLVSTDGDTVVLTAEGKRYLEQAEGLKRAFETFERPGDILRVTAYPSHAGAFANVVGQFADANDGQRIEYFEVTDDSRSDQGARMLKLLADGITDVVIAPAGRKHPRFEEFPLFHWHLRVVVHKEDSLRRRKTVTLPDLSDHRCLMSPFGHLSRQIFEGLVNESGVSPTIAMELMDQGVLLQLAHALRNHAAILPDDFSGTPDHKIGPVLTGRDGKPKGGDYSVYARKLDGRRKSEPTLGRALGLAQALSLAAT